VSLPLFIYLYPQHARKMSIYLTAIVRSKPGQSESLKPLLFDLVAASKQEAACIQYDLHQSEQDPDLFIFHEEWASQEGLELHNSQPHLADFGERSQDLREGQTIIYQTQKVA
jgi:quinol monooxygenase YgiN